MHFFCRFFSGEGVVGVAEAVVLWWKYETWWDSDCLFGRLSIPSPPLLPSVTHNVGDGRALAYIAAEGHAAYFGDVESTNSAGLAAEYWAFSYHAAQALCLPLQEFRSAKSQSTGRQTDKGFPITTRRREVIVVANGTVWLE